MKKKFYVPALLVLMMLFTMIFSQAVLAEENEKTVDVMFLHDTHSHLNAFATVENGESQIMGGFARF